MIGISERSVLALAKALIKIPSVNPTIQQGQGEVVIGAFIAEWFRKTRRFSVYEQRVGNGRFNVIAILPGKADGPSLILNGHMDTVGTTGMTVKPFAPVVTRGRLLGRGSCDMKGALAAMMCAMLSLSKSARKPAGDVLFTAVIDEEYMSIGTSELIKRYRADAAIIGEPTNARVAVAHKGYVWLEIEMEGKAAHGSTPENGIDAIENMARIIRMLDTVRREYRRKRHPLLGTANIHTSSITGGTDWSTIPAKCRLGLERRLMPGDTAEGALRELKRVVKLASIEDRKINAKVRLIHHADSMQVERPPHLAILREQVLRAGGQPRPIGLPFWTDASILWNRGKVPTCIYGPGDIAVAHGQAEHVRVRELVTTARVYAETAAAYCA